MKKEKMQAEAELCPVCGHPHKPGTCCGDCGCCFENRGYTLEGEEHEEKGSLAFSLVSFILSALILAFYFLLTHKLILPSAPARLAPALCLVVYARFAIRIFVNMFREFGEGHFFTESTLMSAASLGALALGEFSEAAAVMFLYSLGEFLSDLAFDRSKDRIEALLDLSEKTVCCKKNGKTVEMCPAEVKTGDIIILHAGEKVTLDGVITLGSASFDTSGITGEGIPASLEEGDPVLSGYLCLDGGIEMRAEKPYCESVASRLADAVTEAGKKKSKKEAFIRTFSRWYTPAMMGAALLVFAFGSVLTGNVILWLKKALALLVISCPCALVLSVPLAYFASIGAGAGYGIMFKGGEAVDAASGLRALAFDKTGTLTQADIRVEKIVSSVSENEFIAIASSALSRSSHPLSKAFVKMYDGAPYPVKESKETAGKGTEAKLLFPTGEKEVFFGSSKMIKENCPGIFFREENTTAVYGATKDTYLGCILFSDTVKEGAKEGIKELKKLGIDEMVILSGDKKQNVSLLAGKVGIPHYFGELLPEDKLNRFEEFLSENREKGTVGYVGDGLNDAAVLIRSDVGFAMGKNGAALSAQAADIVLANDDILNISRAVSIAKKTRKIVFENIVFSLGIKAGILLVCLLSSPVMGLAVAADVGVTLLAVLNCLRIMKK